MSKLEEKVIGVIRENLANNEDREISLNDDFTMDLGLDSIQQMGILFSLEDEFGISIIDDESNYKFFGVQTVKELIEVLEEMDLDA